MKAIQFDQLNPLDAANQEMTGMRMARERWDSKFGGGISLASNIFWNRILAEFGLSLDDIGTGGGLVIKSPSESATIKFQELVSGGSGGAYGATIDQVTGQFQLTLLDPARAKKMTQQQKIFVNSLMDASDMSKPLIVIGLVESSDRVLNGDYVSQEIDVDDIIALGTSNRFSNSYIAFAHEIYEQNIKQRNQHSDEYYLVDHIQAIKNIDDKMSV